MEGIPLVTIEEIEKDEFLFRFACWESILVTWPPPEQVIKDDPQLMKEYSKISEKYTRLEQMIINFGNILREKFLEASDKFVTRH